MPSQLKYPNSVGIYSYEHLQKIKNEWEQTGNYTIDLWKPLQQEIGKDTAYKFSWKIDQHFNTKGYEVMGRAISDSLKKYLHN